MCARNEPSSPGASTQTCRALEALRSTFVGLFQRLLPSPEIHSRVQIEINSLACCSLALLLLLSSTGFPQARIRRNPFRSHDGQIGLMASEASIFSRLWGRILNLTGSCSQAVLTQFYTFAASDQAAGKLSFYLPRD